MHPRALLVPACALAACALAACEPPPEPPPLELAACDASEECGAGLVCVDERCVVGTCDPALTATCRADPNASARCCRPWEVCDDVALTCMADPDARGLGCDPADTTCTPCLEDADCGVGQFCSGLACNSIAGTRTCTSRSDCLGADRCDREHFLCVPNRGNCSRCAELPELCCEDDEVCDDDTDACTVIGAANCADDGDCFLGEFCAVGRCVQCVVDGNCGVGLVCDSDAGLCESTTVCVDDDDCAPALRCSDDGACIVPTCETDADCVAIDPRRRCDDFQCVLGEAVCVETDEPNNDQASALPLTPDIVRGTDLCRGDFDLFTFPTLSRVHYEVAIEFIDEPPSVFAASIWNDTWQLVDDVTTLPTMQLAYTTGPNENGAFYVRVDSESSNADAWPYQVTLAEQPAAAACATGGDADEPNDDAGSAADLTTGERHARTRCGADDVDFARFFVPGNFVFYAEVRLDTRYGALTVALLDEDSSVLAYRDDGNDVVTITHAQSEAHDVVLRVALDGAPTDEPAQEYSVQVVVTPGD